MDSYRYFQQMIQAEAATKKMLEEAREHEVVGDTIMKKETHGRNQ